jgi:hypothetical protein
MPDVRWFPLSSGDLNDIRGKIDLTQNGFIELPAEQLPYFSITPASYREKIIGFTIGVSGCVPEDTTYIMMNMKRYDVDKKQEVIDHDTCGFLINNKTGTPSVSGCVIYHGDWIERTVGVQTPGNASDKKIAINYLRNNFTPASGDLSQMDKSAMAAFEKINSQIQSEQDKNPDTP